MGKNFLNFFKNLFSRNNLFLKTFGIFLGCMLFLFLSFMAYIYTGPRYFPKTAHILEQMLQNILPEESTFTIETLHIEIEKETYRILTKARGVHFKNEILGLLDLPELELSIDLLGLVPGTDKSFLNVRMDSIEGELRKQIESHTFDPEILPKWNGYIDTHKNKLKYLGVIFENISLDVNYFNEPRKLMIRTLHIHPLLNENRLYFEAHGDFVFGTESGNVDLRLGLDTSNVIHLEPTIQLVKGAYIEAQLELSYDRSKPILIGTFSTKNLDLSTVKELWPKTAATGTREWVSTHIHEANIYASEGHLHLGKSELGNPLPKDSFQISAYLNKAKIQYLNTIPAVEDISANLSISESDLKFEVTEGIILKSTLSKIVGVIPDFNAQKQSLKIEGHVNGPLQDCIDLGYAHADLQNNVFHNVSGVADTNVSLRIPLSDEKITLPTLGLSVHSELSDVSAKTLYKNHGLAKGKLSLDLQSSVLKIKGDAHLDNEIPMQIETVINLLKEEKFYLLKSRLHWKDLEKIGINIHESLSESVSVELYKSEKPKDEKTILQLDLTDTLFEMPSLNLIKKQGQPSMMRVDINSDGTKAPFDYLIKLGALESSGKGEFDSGINKIQSLTSASLKVHAEDAAISNIQILYHEPKLTLRTEDFGLALKTFGITDRVIKGRFEFDGALFPELKGEAKVHDIQVKNIPFLMKIMSVLSLTSGSFKSINMLLVDKGIEFSDLKSSFTYKEGKAQIQSLTASGETLSGDLQGELDIMKGNLLTATGVAIPSNLLNSLVKGISIFGKKMGNPIAMRFDATGPLADPTVTVKTLSDLLTHGSD
jgi:hypothetical protein